MVSVLAIAGFVATAQTAVTNISENATKVIPDGQLTGVSDTHSLTLSPLFSGDQLSGTWAAYDHDVDPLYSLDTDTQTLLLGSFGGTNPNEVWTLFLADLDFGEQGTLVKWSVFVTAIPEPSTWALMGLGGIALGMRFVRRRFVR